MRRLVLPLLALIGAISVFVVARTDNQKPAPPQMVTPPAVASYPAYIAGSGIIEATTRNIAIGTEVPGVCVEVFVRVGSRVKAGDPLFRLDDRERMAELASRRAALQTARAKVAEAQASLGDVRNQLRLAEAVTDRRAISLEDLTKRRYAVQLAEARLRTAEAEVGGAEADVAQAQTDIDRLTVRAPITGEVLQVNLRVGEYAQTGVLSTPLMLLGGTDRLNVRVDIDENDAWRFQPGAPARAFLRGNRDLAVDLRFEYVEPYVVPKRSLTGESTERVDTRVLQAVYSFPAGVIPAYIGQQVDVFIKAPSSMATATDNGVTSGVTAPSPEGGTMTAPQPVPANSTSAKPGASGS